jgi:hypothetical protein
MSLDARISEVLDALRSNDESGRLRRAVDELVAKVKSQTGHAPSATDPQALFDFLKAELDDESLKRELARLRHFYQRY